ncbi:spore germination protein [Bacillus xiapuensis]|uniref:spore germination protein n=1 Tax=Bacillus xiapuensis TaxID=2014075 RepID=UPI000C23AC2D|nr:spore germination protein [Bacillus xiapuensis]
MPALVGPIQIFTVSGGVIHYGDALVISPKSSGKTQSGSGGLNTGSFIVTYAGLNTNAVFDPTSVDQPITGNI